MEGKKYRLMKKKTLFGQIVSYLEIQKNTQIIIAKKLSYLT
jgi:hypothetical protein